MKKIIIIFIFPFMLFSQETKLEREKYFKELFSQLDIFYKAYKEEFVKKKGLKPSIFPDSFPDSIKVSMKRRSIERLKRMAKDNANATNDLKLYLDNYFKSILSGHRKIFHGDLVDGKIVKKK